ncbi:MAG: hypothetical protein COW16_10555 [Sphingomonadales bacterium CG12_big_fil_rev_8_21_14_0_65_65_10]|nr:MAG: hypothetical protein COW16_10555 [Sphingomonadales bacterium CG12_big_fil_rev_8_21_14_0_65_65_10]
MQTDPRFAAEDDSAGEQATRDLLISVLVTLDRACEGFAQAALGQADAIAAAAARRGKHAEARELVRLQDEIRVALCLPVNS